MLIFSICLQTTINEVCRLVTVYAEQIGVPFFICWMQLELKVAFSKQSPEQH